MICHKLYMLSNPNLPVSVDSVVEFNVDVAVEVNVDVGVAVEVKGAHKRGMQVYITSFHLQTLYSAFR